MQCKAKSKRSGVQCKRHATPGMQVCYIHGGKSLRGAANPAFIHGRYSKYLPARLAARYQEAAADPELLALREDIALLDSRLADVLGRVDTGESGRVWRELQAAYARLIDARAQGDAGEFASSLSLIGSLVGEGLSDWAAWDEITRLLEERRRLVESERKRLVEMQQMMSNEQAMTLITALSASVTKHVTDRATLSAIQADFTRIMHVESSCPALAE